MGGTMRLGADPVKLHDGTRIRELYGEAGRLRAPPPPLRGQQPPAPAARGGRAGLLGHLAGRAAGRGRSSSPRPPVLRRLPVPPGVQVAARAPGAAVPRVRRRGARARRRRARPEPSRRRRGERAVAPTAPREARHRRRARAPARARSPRCAGSRALRTRARVRRLGRARAARAWGSRSRRTTPAAEPAPTPATCWRGSRGRRATSILLCAHIDTVRSPRRSSRCVVDGGWENAQRGHPRRRQQGRGRRHARARAPAARRRARRRSGIELLFTVCEEIALRGRQGVRRAPPAQPSSATCSTTPRRSARSSSPRRPTTGSPPTSTAGRPRRHPARGRPQRDRRRGARDRGDARSGGSTPQTTANVGTIARRHRDQRRPRALPDRGRGRAASTTRASRQVRDRDDRPPPGRRQRTRECDLDVDRRAAVRGLPDQAARAPEVAVAERALRACGYEPANRHRRRLGRQRASRRPGLPCINLANGTERNHEPDRAGQRRRARGDARRRDRAGRRGRAALREARPREREFERVGDRDQAARAGSSAPASSASATPTARR